MSLELAWTTSDNKTLYEVRQHYVDNGEYLSYYHAYDQLKTNWNYEGLPSQVAQQTMKQVDTGFKSFFNLVEKTRENKYDADGKSPSNLPKDGFYTLEYPSSRFRSKTATFASAFHERTATSSTVS